LKAMAGTAKRKNHFCKKCWTNFINPIKIHLFWLKEAHWAMMVVWNDEKHLSSAVIHSRVCWNDVFQPSSKIKGIRPLIDL
jgi:hypothetical protein